MSSISLTILGGGSEIGANSYLFRANNQRILLDCGFHPKKEGWDALPDLSLLEDEPEAVVVSHGHIDHCGAIPYLMKRFHNTVCYATEPTVRIMDRMLHNSVSVMETLAGERGIEEYPLYGHRDVDLGLRRCYGVRRDREYAVTKSRALQARFHHAGHVLGSACISLETAGHSLFYTGDICFTDQELMHGFALPDESLRVDTLVTECTRGTQSDDRVAAYGDEIHRFAHETAAVLNQGGCVLAPSFALGRTQELLNIIARLMENGELPDVPVYSSGLGRAVYDIYRAFPEYLDPAANLRPLVQFLRIGDVWDRRAVRRLLQEPAIFVATSGMMVENTPSSLIAQEMIGDNQHGIFFVGYLDPDTLGYHLLRAKVGDKLAFELGGRARKIVMENRQSFSLSAHATREDLCALIERLRPANVVFVHGDADAVEWMVANTNGSCRKYAPKLGETITLEA